MTPGFLSTPDVMLENTATGITKQGRQENQKSDLFSRFRSNALDKAEL